MLPKQWWPDPVDAAGTYAHGSGLHCSSAVHGSPPKGPARPQGPAIGTFERLHEVGLGHTPPSCPLSNPLPPILAPGVPAGCETLLAASEEKLAQFFSLVYSLCKEELETTDSKSTM